MSSRDEILRAVRAAQPDPVPHPGVPGGSPGGVGTGADAGTGGDLGAAFARALEEAGGTVVEPRAPSVEDAAVGPGGGPDGGPGAGPGGGTSGGPSATRDRVALLLAERFSDARIASSVPGLAGNVDLAAVADPHDLADLDVVVCRAALGVAENGAVWLPESAMGHRAAPFLAQHMVVVLARDAIVADLHAAYQAIDVGASGFGLFVAGPSKTADIEQSLVMGAHGPRSLTLVLSDGDV